MPEFSEDMGRKARWFYELNGSTDRAFLDDLRDKAIAHVERMREARISRLDPGGGSIADPFVLVGAGGATLSRTTTPGQAGDVFVTAAIQVDAADESLNRTLKVKLRRGTSGFDLATTRLFRYDPERETWVRIDASGWNAKDKYVWGRVDRPAVYAAVALPKDPEALRRVAFETFARRTIRDGVASGQFGSAADFADRSALRNYLIDAGHVDVDRAGDRKHLDAILKVHRRFVRDLGADLGRESIGGNPQWSLLSHLLAFRGQFLTHLDLDVVLPFWPIIARVANRVGPWFHLGPNNINGRVKSIALHPGNSDVIWAGAANGGVWKSTNGGDSWSTKWKFEDSLAIGAVAAAPSNGDVVYAGTGEDTPGWGPNFGGAGLYKSRNGGGTWERIASTGDVGSYCNKIVVHPTNSRKVYVAADSGVYRADIGLATTIGGDPVITWKKVLTGRATDLVMQHDHPNVLLAGIHNKGVYKTVDGGDHWTRIEGLKVTVFAIIFAFKENVPVDGDAGWIKLAMGRSGEHGSNQVVVKLGKDSATTLLSADAGETWLKTPGSVGVDYDEWCSLVALHPRQPLHIYLASVNMKHSTDGWNYLDSPGTHSDHHQMAFHRSNDDVAFVCCDGGVYRTTDNGSSWHLRSDLLSATQLMSLGVSATGDFVAGSATQDQGIIQTNGSTNWVDHGGGNEWGMFVVDPNDSRNIFISPGGGQIRRSTDRGVSYTAPTSGLTDWWAAQNRNTIAASFAHAAVKPGNSDIVVGPATVTEDVKDANGNVTATYPAKHRIYYSTNGGVDWSNAFTLPHRGSRIAFAPSNHSRVYVATSQGRVYRSDSSGTGGWSEPASAADRPPGQNITSIAVDPANSGRVYITYGGSGMAHIYRSTNAGATWSPCDGSGAMQLPDIALLDVVIDSENSDVLYAASAIGVFRSNDRGSTWYWANDGLNEHDLPRVMVTGLAIQPSTHRLYASTMGRGLYYTQATGIVSMRATHVKLAHELPEPSGILKLKLTDGSNTYVMTRLEVIRRIQAGTEVYTLGPGGTRTRVRVLQPDAVHPLEYLSTSPDGTTTNNLLSLPRFYG